MKLYLIRHGATLGNTGRRYIGRTDEPLCESGRRQLQELSLPRCDMLVCSPMKRCLETAEILFPGQQPVVIDELRECDFGEFEGHDHAELDGGEYYQKWIDSMGTLPFPGGEDPADFKRRSIGAFLQAVKAADGCGSLAMVVHDGTIMSVLERFTGSEKHYYDWHVDNGHGYLCELEGSSIAVTEEI